jgi:hypothetical protein
MRARTVLPALLLLTIIAAPSATLAKRPKLALARLVRTVSSVRSTALTVARALGARAKSASSLVLRSEPIDTRYPALSLPGDLPKIDYPNRASLARPVRWFGKKATARLLSALAVIKSRKRRVALLGKRKRRIVVVVTLDSDKAKDGIAQARVEKLLRKLGARALGSGRLGVCGKHKPWCYTRALLIDAHKGHYRVHVHLELSAPASSAKARVRGVKVVRWP